MRQGPNVLLDVSGSWTGSFRRSSVTPDHSKVSKDYISFSMNDIISFQDFVCQSIAVRRQSITLSPSLRRGHDRLKRLSLSTIKVGSSVFTMAEMVDQTTRRIRFNNMCNSRLKQLGSPPFYTLPLRSKILQFAHIVLRKLWISNLKSNHWAGMHTSEYESL